MPVAQIHVTTAEALGAMRPPTRMEKFRLRPAQWAHFYYRGTVDGRSHVPAQLRVSELLTALDRRAVRNNHSRLTELYARRDPSPFIVSAHDPTVLAEAVATSR